MLTTSHINADKMWYLVSSCYASIWILSIYDDSTNLVWLNGFPFSTCLIHSILEVIAYQGIHVKNKEGEGKCARKL